MSNEKQRIVFETERLIVRHFTIDDTDDFFRMNSDVEIMRYIRPVKSRAEAALFFTEVLAYSIENPAYGRMAVIEKQSGILVGSFAIIPLQDTAFMQLGYSLFPAWWGKGFATELTKAGIVYAFTHTDMNEIFGITEALNTHSQKVLLKAGFKLHDETTEGIKKLFRYIYLKQDFNH